MKSFFTLAFILWSLVVFGQSQEVIWTFNAKKVNPQTYVVKATATISNGWYVYSQYLESEEGPIATHWTFEENALLELVGDPTEKGSKVSGYDELFAMNITKYRKKMFLEQTISVPKGQRRAQGSITFMSCNDKQCMPPVEVEFSVKL